MMNRGIVAAVVCVCLLALSQANSESSKAKSGERSAQMQVAPDLKQRLARFRQVQMPFHSEGLSEREKKLVLKLVDASRCLEDI